MFIFDLDDFDQASNDFSTGGEIGLVETIPNLIGKIIQSAEHRLQFLTLGSLFPRCSFVVFQSIQPLASTSHSRFEFGLLQQAIFISVDQSADTALYRTDLFGELIDIEIRFGLVRQTLLELVTQRLRVLKYGANVGPHRCV